MRSAFRARCVLESLSTPTGFRESQILFQSAHYLVTPCAVNKLSRCSIDGFYRRAKISKATRFRGAKSADPNASRDCFFGEGFGARTKFKIFCGLVLAR